MPSPFGPWEPLSIRAVAELFADAPVQWWISGGHALELHTGRSWRGHDDTDVSVLRSDASALVEKLDGWEIHLAAAGVLTRWDGSPLRQQDHHNNLWVRTHADGPWVLDVTIADGDHERWIYRRQPEVGVGWPDAVLMHTATGIRYLAPELQLLFKSVDIRPKDDIDATQVIPDLAREQAAWLRAALPTNHRWQSLLAMRPDG